MNYDYNNNDKDDYDDYDDYDDCDMISVIKIIITVWHLWICLCLWLIAVDSEVSVHWINKQNS